MTHRQKYTLKALGLLIISPVYVPAVILYEQRSQVTDFYREAFMILNNTHPDLSEPNG